MTSTPSALPPRLLPPHLDDDAVHALAPYRLPSGDLIPLFATLAHSGIALKDLRSATKACIRDSSIGLRLREIAILRVCVVWDVEAEWSTHVAMFAGAAGLDTAALADLARSPAQGSWTALERTVIDSVDVVSQRGSLDDVLWSGLEQWLAPSEIVELLMVIGQYIKVAVTTKALRLSPLPGMPRFSEQLSE